MDNLCVKDNIKCDVNQYTTTPTPTLYTTSRHTYHKSANTHSHAANSLLKTINFNLEDMKQWAILDSGATSHFLSTDTPIEDERQTLNPITTKLPDGRRVTSTQEGKNTLAQPAGKGAMGAQHAQISNKLANICRQIV